MLLALGPGVTGLQDYSRWYDYRKTFIEAAQGDALDTFNTIIHDPTSSFTIVPEDDLVCLDETDTNGWPSCQLLLNPSFEGTYSGGVAPNWLSFAASGVTYAKNTTTTYNGSGAQQISYSNGSTTVACSIYQQITLPTDEYQNPILALPYVASCYVYVQTGFSNVSGLLLLEYLNSSGSTVLQSYSATLNLGAAAGWFRVSVSGVGVAGSVLLRLRVRLIGTSATNSGVLLLDAAQLEYATFANVRSRAYPLPYVNPQMAATSGVSTATGWTQDGATTGVTYSMVTTPTVGTAPTAQQIACSSVAAATTTRAIAQNGVPINPGEVYTLTLLYQITSALPLGAFMKLGINWEDVNSGFLANAEADGPSGEGVSATWRTLTLRIGPNTPNPAPLNAARIKLFTGLVSPSATLSGTVVIGQFLVTPDPIPAQPMTAEQTAYMASLYPTPFIDPALAGKSGNVYQDRGYSNLYYRHLRLFAGYARVAEVDYTDQGGAETDITIKAVDYSVLLQEAPADFVMDDQSDVGAINKAFSYAQGLGFLVGVDYSTYVIGIQKVYDRQFSWVKTRDVMNDIANQTVAAYYIDYNKYLHYGPALAASAPFGVSNTPDYGVPTPGTTPNTFPMSGLKYSNDSTASVSEAVVEGSTTLSANQTYTDVAQKGTLAGTTATLSGGTLAAGATSLPVVSGGTSFTNGTVIVAGVNTATAETLTVGAGSTATSIVLQSATQNAHSGGDVVGVRVLTNGSNYTSLTLASATTQSLSKGAVLQIGVADTVTQPTVPTAIASGTTTLTLNSFTAAADYGAGEQVATIGWQVNGGAPIVVVYTASVNGVQAVVGDAQANSFGQGYTALVNAQAATIIWSTPQTTGAVSIIFAYNTPVLVRLHNPPADSPTGTLRRKIHTHIKEEHISAQQAAVDRANAELAQRTRAKPIGKIIINSPPWPAATPLRPGTAIPVTFTPAKLTGQLYQIVKVRTSPLGFAGQYKYELDIGFYEATMMIQLAHAMNEANIGDVTPDTVLQDVQSASDGWALGDSASATVQNIGVWGGPSTWGGTYDWG